MLTVIDRVNEALYNRLIANNDAPYHGTQLNIIGVSGRMPDIFPTLSVVSLGETTAASDLQHTEQAAIWSTLELKAYSVNNLYESSQLLNDAGDILLSLGYHPTLGPETLSDTSPYCKVARFRAFFGAGDLGWRFG